MRHKLSKEDVGFTQIKNDVLYSPTISLKAKGLFAYLYSKPDNWDFSGDRIAADMLEGRKTIYATLKELEDAGYISRSRLSDGHMNYYITWKPTPQNGQEVDYATQKPTPQNGTWAQRPVAETGSIYNKEDPSNIDIKVIKTSSAQNAEANDHELIVKVIELFHEVNPSFRKLFPNKTQRAAAKRLLELHGLETLAQVVTFLGLRINDRYCPTITTPVQLEDKWGALQKYGVTLKQGSGKGREIISSVE